MADMISRILDALKGKKAGLDPKELSRRVGVRKSKKSEYKQAVETLLEDNRIVRHKGKFLIAGHAGLVEGTVVKVAGTFGFARLEEKEKDVFIPGRDLLGALPGDRVLLKCSRGEGQLPEGKVYQIVEEKNTVFSGVIREEEGRLLLQPDRFVRFPMALEPGTDRGARPGEKVVARVLRRGKRHSEHVVEVVERFGSADSAAACSRAVLAANGILTEFPPEDLEQARAIAAGDGIHPKELATRLDLRDKPIFTIDGADSKDLDDAVSLERKKDGWELGVHIADVSYYVTHRSPLDLEALARGTSVYYADSVIPMLPEELSNGVCSLNPGEDRLAFSAFLELDGSGKLVGYRFVKTAIRSRVKGVYGEVNAILEGNAEAPLLEKYRDLTGILEEMRELAALLGRNRRERGSVNLESVESKILVGPDGRAVGVEPRVMGISENIIEEFMLTANEAAAAYALQESLPFVYRVHDRPAPDKLATLGETLDALGVSYSRGAEGVSPGNLNAILAQVRGTKLEPVVNTMILRSMSKAQYSDKNTGHFGIALDRYTHFTSPIRRYPDLTIHRILSGLVTGMKRENIHKRFGEFAGLSASQSTGREIAAMTAERDCEDCYKAEYMRAHVGEEMDGVVSSATSFGLYIQLPNTVEGLLNLRDFPQGDWSFDGRLGFTERATGRRMGLGDAIRVMVARADVSAGQVDFTWPAGE